MLLAFCLTDSRLGRRTILALAVLVVTQNMYIQSSQQARAWVTQRHDLLLAASLNDDILRMVGPVQGTEIKLDFHGYRRVESVYPPVPTTTMGESFFSWDGGDPLRMVLFMNLSGFHWYRPLSQVQRDAARGAYTDMPIWPRPGSIKVVEGPSL